MKALAKAAPHGGSKLLSLFIIRRDGRSSGAVVGRFEKEARRYLASTFDGAGLRSFDAGFRSSRPQATCRTAKDYHQALRQKAPNAGSPNQEALRFRGRGAHWLIGWRE